MHLSSFFVFKNSFHALVIIIIFFSTFAYATLSPSPSPYRNFESCLPQNCGNGPSISYPFWIAGQQESYCGHPNFEVYCTDQNPVVQISDDYYIIKDIFYADNSFLLASSKACDFNITCPIPLHNFSTEGTPFDYSPSYVDLHFFYDCKSNYRDATYQVSCASNATHYSFADFHIEILEQQNYSIESCQSWVRAPAESKDISILLGMNFTDVLRKGFVLQWNESNCSDCERSGGHCGSAGDDFICFCPDGPYSRTCRDGGRKNSLAIIVIVISTIGTIFLACASLIFWRIKKTCSGKSMFFWRKSSADDNVEAFLKINGSFVPKRYSYSSVKKITNSFRDKLGQGGYGGVFKGKLVDGRVVAVKLLNKTKGDGKEFINEVASISRTSHVNIVSLLGYCFQGHKRALIYEYMPNGSLEKFINTNKPQFDLEWKVIHKIALGVARGLEYLHRGCTTRIFHFDIKPHNILLDEDFSPKISDFGLAKLCPQKESIVSMLYARGTIGYIAPEVFSRQFGRVSNKADIYSYGMLLLDIVSGREEISECVSEITSETYFPHSIYKKLEGDHLGIRGIKSIEDEKIARKIIIIGLYCIQYNPAERPAINKVIEMLEGNLESLQIPREPFLTSSRSLIPASNIQISSEINESSDCDIE